MCARKYLVELDGQMVRQLTLRGRLRDYETTSRESAVREKPFSVQSTVREAVHSAATTSV